MADLDSSDEEDYGKFSDHVDLKSAAISVPKGEPAVVLNGAYLFSVEHLRVTHPDRHAGDLCPIYGQISVSNIGNPSDPRVTLYNRSREDAETVDIGDPKHNFLSLSDGESVAQPIQGDFPIFLTMRLFEKKATVDEDTPIAMIEWDFGDFFDFFSGKILWLELKGESGLMFTLSYSIISPAIWAEVEFRMNRDIYEDAAGANKKRKQPSSSNIHIYGSIEAHQLIASKTSVRLYSRGIDKAEYVDFGSLIHLDRKAVVVPIGEGALSIDYAFHCPYTEHVIAQGTVPFYIKPLGCIRFKANPTLKHTKHVDNGLFSVSLTFFPIRHDQKHI